MIKSKDDKTDDTFVEVHLSLFRPWTTFLFITQKCEHVIYRPVSSVTLSHFSLSIFSLPPPSVSLLLFEASCLLPTLCISSTVNWLSLISLTVSSPTSSYLLLLLPQSPAGWSQSAGGVERRWKGKNTLKQKKRRTDMRAQLQDSPPENRGQETIFPTTVIIMAACPQSPKYFVNKFNPKWREHAVRNICRVWLREQRREEEKTTLIWTKRFGAVGTDGDGDSREEKLKKHRAPRLSDH